jgi:ABC-type transport system involved in multi-copper enzyme maturation permease subunit
MTAPGAGGPGAASRIAIQSMALLVDAYRELDAKKLFWITMVLSGLVVAIFACFGLNERGLTFLWWEFPLPLFNSTIFPPASFYKFIFATIGIPIWLTWVAAILALISTAGIFPDFISGGSIELALSKPISRLRLFVTKYITGLLFVFLQVLVFTLACFLVIGLRGDRWDFALLLAVPIVVCFYSYIFCVCVLFGLLTRSTIASILLTCLFWLLVFGCNLADAILLQQKVTAEISLEKQEARLARGQKRATERLDTQRAEAHAKAAADAQEAGAEPPPAPEPREYTQEELDGAYTVLPEFRDETDKAREGLETWTWWSTMIYRTKTVLPKTGETVDLLNRYLLTAEERAMFLPRDNESSADLEEATGVSQAELGRAMAEETHERTVWWIVGTSLVFEGVIVGIAGVIFVRRDF